MSNLYADPRHTYTRALLSAVPKRTPDEAKNRQILGGEPGRGFYQMMDGVEVGRVNVAARACGISIRAFELAIAYAQQRIQRQGLDNLATFHFEDYRHTEGQYDHIGSIEMIEAGRADQLVVAYSIGWCVR